MDQELVKQLGYAGAAGAALIVVWKFLKAMIERVFATLEKQNNESQQLLRNQTQVFSDTVAKRDAQMDAIVEHLHESTAILKTINGTSDRIEVKIDKLKQ